MTVDELATAIVKRARTTGQRDICAAQNSVNLLNVRLGAVCERFADWYSYGAEPSSYLDELAGDLAVEAVALLVNIVGVERAADVLRQRVKVTKR